MEHVSENIRIKVEGSIFPRILKVYYNDVYVGELKKDGTIFLVPEHEGKREEIEQILFPLCHPH